MHYAKIGEYIGKGMAQVLGAVPERVLREELRRFKQLLEAGEIPTTAGQPSGRRPVMESARKAIANVTRMPERTGEKTA